MDAGDGEGGITIDAEKQLLEGELAEVECTLVGEVQQIEILAQENKKKVKIYHTNENAEGCDSPKQHGEEPVVVQPDAEAVSM